MTIKTASRMLSLLVAGVALCLASVGPARAQAPNPNPPAQPVKLIFIHHSTGGNWLADPNDDQPSGGLGIALRDNNYYVSATNYGWGPDDIGDRTDIVNWPEWFTGSESQRTLRALYTGKGQNVGDFGRWSRLARDPGGENEIVLFKSCFPNSDLYGGPNDPPAAEPTDEMTVANAKAVYNRLLTYFATRPDKLFIVITAPPMADFDYGGGSPTPAQRAANARAFNNWLVGEWLAGYPHANVGVFDYFNVLTSNAGSPEANDLGQAGGNHHRWRNGQIEYIQTVDSDYSAYPSGDSHPSSAGHRKATAEFVPLLNITYHRWKQGGGAAAPVSPVATQPPYPSVAPPTPQPAKPTAAAPSQAPQPTTSTSAAAPPAAGVPVGLIEGWEGENWWQCNGDGQGSTIEGAVDGKVTRDGAGALRITYKLVQGGWSDCGTSFEAVRDWSGASGLALSLHADTVGLPVTVVLFSGDPNAQTPFVAEWETTQASASGWADLRLPWDQFARAEWADQGIAKLDPARVHGLALNVTAGQGTLWVDDIALFTGQAGPPAAQAPTAAPDEVPAADPPEPTKATKGGGLPCLSSAMLPLALMLAAHGCRRGRP